MQINELPSYPKKDKRKEYVTVQMDAAPQTAHLERRGLKTYGVGPCIAFCGEGSTDKSKRVIGLYHWSGAKNKESLAEEARTALVAFANCMLNKQCTSFKLHLIGGQKADADCSGTEAEQEMLQSILNDSAFREQYKITDFTTNFNLTTGDDSLDLFMRYAVNYYVRAADDNTFDFEDSDSYNSDSSSSSSAESTSEEDSNEETETSLPATKKIKI